MAVITLTTDFGLRDPYVGVMHAVIAQRAPEVRVIDFTHGVRPQSVVHGGLALAQAWRYAPTGSVHVAVVDPGVGSARAALVAEAAGHRFVLPDNGLLALAVDAAELTAVHRVERRDWFLPELSRTFHGRDVFAPVAAELALGATLADCGPAIGDWQCCELPRPRPLEEAAWQGEVLWIDHFGNAITNLDQRQLDATSTSSPVGGGWQLVAADQGFPGVDHYAAVEVGRPLALVGSSGRLECAVRDGDAVTLHGLEVGMPVELRPRPPPA